MGRLYDACQQVANYIETHDYDVFKTRGAIALETGFLISLIKPDDPDDPARLQGLVEASQKILGFKPDV
jgi:hypothetical protein